MKKVLLFALTIFFVFGLALAVGAESEEVTVPLPDEQASAPQNSEVVPDIDYSAVAKQFASYIQSGEAPEELIDSMIAMGEEMKEMKERGYTLKERLLQLVSSENVLKTTAALFMIIGSILFFFIRKKLKNSGYDIEDNLMETRAIRDSLKKEKEAREAGEAELKACREELAEVKLLLAEISQGMQKVGKGSVGVAKMVKDVFLNSRTLDADGKALMTHNFVEAVGELNGGQDEQQGQV